MRISITSAASFSKPVNRASNPRRATVEDVGIDHGRLHVAMAQQFLDSADIVAAFQEMRGE